MADDGKLVQAKARAKAAGRACRAAVQALAEAERVLAADVVGTFVLRAGDPTSSTRLAEFVEMAQDLEPNRDLEIVVIAREGIDQEVDGDESQVEPGQAGRRA